MNKIHTIAIMLLEGNWVANNNNFFIVNKKQFKFALSGNKLVDISKYLNNANNTHWIDTAHRLLYVEDSQELREKCMQDESLFRFSHVMSDQANDYDWKDINYVKIQRKDIGFTFTIRKNDPKDIDRMQFVYDVTLACNGCNLLLPLAKKQIPKWDKLNKKYPGKISLKEYSNMDIHNKLHVIKIIKKIIS